MGKPGQFFKGHLKLEDTETYPPARPMTETVLQEIANEVTKEMEAEIPSGAQEFVCIRFIDGEPTLNTEVFQEFLEDEETKVRFEKEILGEMNEKFPDFREKLLRMQQEQDSKPTKKAVTPTNALMDIPPTQAVQLVAKYSKGNDMESLELAFLDETKAALCNPTEHAVVIKARNIPCFFHAMDLESFRYVFSDFFQESHAFTSR